MRGWSAVWRVVTGDDGWYAKQNRPGQHFEAALLAVLTRHTARVVPPTAVDVERGFLLTPDQRPVFGETVGDELEPWCVIAREGALLQRGLTDDVAELSADDATRLRALLPDVRRWAEETSALGLPASLNHNDLHENNVFAVDGGLRFFDFGDAMVIDPLNLLRVTLGTLAARFECRPGDPRVERVASAALEVWSDLTPLAERRAGLSASLQLARLARSESWRRAASRP